jgi:adenine-specific DNA-methyltransferase
VSSSAKQKLELTWIGKEDRPRLEPRILLEDPARSHHAARRVSEADKFDNRLIFGDNLLALKALEAEFAGKIKCIYIDPPYNTGSAFEHYDDAIEHSLWLSLMRDRLEIMRRLLHPDGIIFAHIDDSEGAYLKALMDESFGRDRYIVTFYVQVRYPEKTLKQDMLFNKVIEQVHCYGNTGTPQIRQPVERYDLSKFEWYVEETGTPRTIELGGKRVDVFDNGMYRLYADAPTQKGLKEIWATGTILDGNSSGRFFRDYLGDRKEVDGLGVLYKVHDIGDDGHGFRYFTGPKKATATKGKYFQGVPVAALDSAATKKLTISNFMDLAASFGNCRHEGGVEFRSGKKPETLLMQLLQLATEEGDWVLDSFGGSGTTGAVAHKMGRRWIMVELGEHCHTHIIPRLTKVIDGQDPGGVTEATGWKGGGGFRYSKLAPSLLEKDRFGNWVISKEFNREQLAEAVCKLEGFAYNPSDTVYWQHGRSTERDFIYVTTQTLTRDTLAHLSDEVGTDKTLLVVCKAFSGKNTFANLTIKKIPKAVMSKCEWGKDDYSLSINALPEPEPSALTASPGRGGVVVPGPVLRGSRKPKTAESTGAGGLFGGGGDGPTVTGGRP